MFWVGSYDLVELCRLCVRFLEVRLVFYLLKFGFGLFAEFVGYCVVVFAWICLGWDCGL